MRVLVVGWQGHGNIGDDAYGLAFERLLPDADVEFRDRAGPDADLLILGGGDVVHGGFTRSFTPSQAERTVVASVSVTASSDFEFLKRCRRVIVRDSASREACVQRGAACEVRPDFAFALVPDAERGRRWLRDRFAAEGKDLYERVVCCVPNAYTFFGGRDSPSRDVLKALSVADDLAWVCDHLDASVVFLPFGVRGVADDRVPAGYIHSRTKWHRKHLVVYDRLDVRTTLDVAAACDALVGNRLHALIFAAIGGTPFVALDHHAKIGGFVAELGRPDWSVPFYGFPRDAALSRLDDHLARGDASLGLYADRARRDVMECLK